MLHVLVGRVTDITPGSYTARDGAEHHFIEVTIAAGSEACVTRGNDDQYTFDEKVAVKVSSRVFGSIVRYDRKQKIEFDVLCSDIAVWAGL